MSKPEEKTVDRPVKTEDRPVLMPRHLRDCVRWALRLNRDKVMTEEEILKRYKEEQDLQSDPVLLELPWMKYLYVEKGPKRFNLGITFTNWPSADDVCDFITNHYNYCDTERVDRILVERLHRPPIA